MDRTGTLYFSMPIFSTVDFDVTAEADSERLVVTLQMLFDLVLVGLGVKMRCESRSEATRDPEERGVHWKQSP